MNVAALVGKILASLLALVLTLRYSAGVIAWRAANKLERPKYETLERIGGGVEVRRYEPYLVAEATIRSSKGMQPASGAGFRKLAGYIFGGKNRDRRARANARSMAMTAPVTMWQEKSGTWRPTPDVYKVSFVMASNETVRTLPIPTDSDVKIQRVAGHTAGYLAFSGGRPTEDLVASKRAALESALQRHGRFRPVRNAATLVKGYHDPFITPNFLRRNEVGFHVVPIHD